MTGPIPFLELSGLGFVGLFSGSTLPPLLSQPFAIQDLHAILVSFTK